MTTLLPWTVASGLAWLHSAALKGEVEEAARSSLPILISGEPGTGKRFVARWIHERRDSDRSEVIRIDAGEEAVPMALWRALRNESVSQGRGAATVLVEGLERLSGPIRSALEQLVDVRGDSLNAGGTAGSRVVTTIDSDALKDGIPDHLPENLFYRLNTVHLAVPPIRERRSDIPRLVSHWLSDCGNGARMPKLSTAALNTLSVYSWPLNMRELKTVSERLSRRSGMERVSEAEAERALDSGHESARDTNAPRTDGR